MRGGRLRFGTNGVQRAHLQRRCALPPMFDAWPAGLQRLTANGVEAHGCRSMRTGERTVECTVVCSPTVHSSLGFSVLCHVRRARLTSRAVCCFFRASKPSDELLLQHVEDRTVRLFKINSKFVARGAPGLIVFVTLRAVRSPNHGRTPEGRALLHRGGRRDDLSRDENLRLSLLLQTLPFPSLFFPLYPRRLHETRTSQTD